MDRAVLGGFCRVRSADRFCISSYSGEIGGKILLSLRGCAELLCLLTILKVDVWKFSIN